MSGRLARLRGGAGLSGGQAWAGFWCFADQGLTSAVNFLTVLILARSLAPADFGVFFIVYTVIYFASNVQTMLIVLPHQVLAAPLKKGEYNEYTANAAGAQLTLATTLASVALIAGGAAYAAGAGFASLLIAMPAALFAWQLQEFVRQVQYTEGRSGRAFVFDAVRYGGQLALLAALWRLDALSGATAMYAIAASSAVSFLFAMWRTRLRFARLTRDFALRSWRFGKWLLAENAGQWLSTEMYPWLLVGFAGPSAVGVLKAVHNIMAPSHVVFGGLRTFAVPRASRAYDAGGRAGMLAFLVPLALLIALPLTAYWLTIGLLGSSILKLLYGPAYAQYDTILWLFILTYAFQYVGQVALTGLIAQGPTRVVFVGRVVAIAVTLTAGAWLVSQHGVEGALVGLIATNASMAVVLVYSAVNATRSERREPVTTLAPAGGEL